VSRHTLAIYQGAVEYAISRGIIIADTKMEFGMREGSLMLIDELLTPDSSRFWPAASYEPGRAQESYDKQFVRDYLISVKFNRQPPGPVLPEEIIQKTSALYREALKKLTGSDIQ
jgi:phosphoribosylaminoimidazole-succinocarboxamide synthase